MQRPKASVLKIWWATAAVRSILWLTFLRRSWPRKVSWIETHLRELTSEVIPNKVIVKGVLESIFIMYPTVTTSCGPFAFGSPSRSLSISTALTEDDTVDVWGRVEFCDLEPKTEKPTCEWRQTAIVEICAQVTESQQLTFVTGVTEIQQAEEPEPRRFYRKLCRKLNRNPSRTSAPPALPLTIPYSLAILWIRSRKNHGVSTNQVIRGQSRYRQSQYDYPGQVIQVPCPAAWVDASPQILTWKGCLF